MDRPKTTPKDFFYWAGAMIAFYWSTIAFILLIFNYIDYAFPNALSYLPDPYSSSIPYEMASILVLFPIFVVVSLLIRRDIRIDPSRKDVWVRRWALIFTLFVAGLTITIDVITLLTKFFSGEELTGAFLMKVALVCLVAAAAFMHFIADYWGYWNLYPSRERSVGIGVIVLMLAAIVSGFFIVGTPWQARLQRFDEQKVTDLQNIQYQIATYWQQKQKLPAALTDLTDSISGMKAPFDAQTGQPYEYRATGNTSFEICATFNEPSPPYAQGVSATRPALMNIYPAGNTSDNWQHGNGRTCFERSIDPSRYPLLQKTVGA